MHARTFTMIVIALLTALPDSLQTSAPPAQGPFRLREGTWMLEGPKSIIGSGIDRIVTLEEVEMPDADGAKPATQWSVTLTTIRHFSVNDRRDPQHTTQGPFAVTVNEAESTLHYKDADDKRVIQTFAYMNDGATLVLPAFVEVEPGILHYIDGRERHQIQCAQDFRAMPVGACSVAGVQGGRGFYSYEEVPRSRDYTDDKSARHLRVLERVEDGGYLIERERLVWDAWGAPRHERVRSTGEPARSSLAIGLWHSPARDRDS